MCYIRRTELPLLLYKPSLGSNLETFVKEEK